MMNGGELRDRMNHRAIVIVIWINCLLGWNGLCQSETEGQDLDSWRNEVKRLREEEWIRQASEMRKSFQAVYGNDFALVDDWINPRGEWIVVLKPYWAEWWRICYEETNKQTHRKIATEYPLIIEPRGSKRIVAFRQNPRQVYHYPDLCIGDEVLLSIRLKPESEQYRFIAPDPRRGVSVWGNASRDAHRTISAGLAHQLEGENPARDLLEYRGSSLSPIADILGNLSVDVAGVFEAKRQGELNLHLYGKGYPKRGILLSIRIVPASKPVRVLASHASIAEELGSRSSSHGSWDFSGSEYTIRVGDLLSIQYWFDATMKHSINEIVIPPLIIETQPFEVQGRDMYAKRSDGLRLPEPTETGKAKRGNE